MQERRHSGARALPASPESRNTSQTNQRLGLCLWVPGSAPTGRPETAREFFSTLLVRSVRGDQLYSWEIRWVARSIAGKQNGIGHDGVSADKEIGQHPDLYAARSAVSLKRLSREEQGGARYRHAYELCVVEHRVELFD